MDPGKLAIINPDLAITMPVNLPEFSAAGITVEVLRLDQVHPVISGNKWFKLKNYLAEALEKKCDLLLTFGGAFSNHLLATACAAKETGLGSVGFVRGERAASPSHTLRDAQAFGMQLEFISRKDYQEKENPSFLSGLRRKFPSALIIPEGGAGRPGVEGSGDILRLADSMRYSHLVCAVGTGTMFQGLANGTAPHQQVWGVCVLRGMKDLVSRFGEKYLNPGAEARGMIFYDYDFGGYGKKNPQLFEFMSGFYHQTGIQTDFVYTAKLFYGVIDLVRKGRVPRGSTLLVVHSGGLQGNGSLQPGTLPY